MVFCSSCGKELDPNSKFCLNCGAAVTPSVLPQNEAPRPRKRSHLKRNIAIVVVLLIVVVISAPALFILSTWQSSLSSPVNQVTQVSSSLQYDVTIYFSNQVASSIGSYNQPAAGDEYLIVTLNIQDIDAQTFDVSPLYFYVIVNNAKYSYDASTFALSNPLKSVQLLPGGSTSGSVAFEVPANGESSYTITYEPIVANSANINWVSS